MITLNTACVPTIWDIGVTSGGEPTSARTFGISAITSPRRSVAFWISSWLMRFDIMPPGTWWEYTFMCVSEETPRL